MYKVKYQLICLLLFLLSFSAVSAQKQVEITNFFAKLYLAPSINSKFMGLAQKGERYNIVMSSNYWCRIDFKGVPVWVESVNIQVVDSGQPISNVADEKTADTQPSNTTANVSKIDSQPLQTSMRGNTYSSENVQSYTPPQYSSQAQTSQATLEQIRANEIRKARIQDSIEKNSKQRRWLMRQNLSRAPVIEQSIEEKQKDKLFLVLVSPVKILLNLSPDSPILGMVNRGEKLPLIGEGDAWCKVVYRDTVGWVEKKQGRIIETGTGSFFIEYRKELLIAGIFLLLLIVGAIIMFIIIRINKNNSQVDVKSENAGNKRVLIVAKDRKNVTSSLTGTSSSIDKSFAEIGFSTKVTSNIQNLQAVIDSYIPDVLLIDWRFDKTLLNSIDRYFIPSGRSNTIIIVIYNVPDPSAMFANPHLPKMAFLGTSFTDSELFKIVTPLLLAVEENSQSDITHANEPSALEGDISGGNLLEVFQFIEAGRKNGCLLVNVGIKPFCLIYINNGRIIYAANAEGQIGRNAIFSVLDLKEGNFKFMLDKQPKAANSSLSILDVLMSWTKEIDETSKHGLRSS